MLNVNVEFMLCPTEGMNNVFALVPDWVIWPSYRSIMVILVCIVGSFMSHCYVKMSKDIVFLEKLLLDIKNDTFNLELKNK